jgi:hypothetical protein
VPEQKHRFLGCGNASRRVRTVAERLDRRGKRERRPLPAAVVSELQW